MLVTYLVLAHTKPAQFASLVETLTRHGDAVVAHIDAKADQEAFRRHLGRGSAAIEFTPERHDIRWGGFGSVAAELAMLERAVRVAPADYYVLLSGVDYPIRPRSQLVAELASGAVYMESWPMPDPRHNKPINRLERVYFPPKNRNSRLFGFVNKAALILPPRRDVQRGLGGRRPYGGSQWWALPHRCADQMLGFVRSQPGFVAFFRRSRNPDEMFFQTIVENLPHRPESIRPPLTYANWAPDRLEVGGTAPATLTVADIPVLRQRHAFFARKFDLDRDPTIFDEIDDQLLQGSR